MSPKPRNARCLLFCMNENLCNMTLPASFRLVPSLNQGQATSNASLQASALHEPPAFLTLELGSCEQSKAKLNTESRAHSTMRSWAGVCLVALLTVGTDIVCLCNCTDTYTCSTIVTLSCHSSLLLLLLVGFLDVFGELLVCHEPPCGSGCNASLVHQPLSCSFEPVRFSAPSPLLAPIALLCASMVRAALVKPGVWLPCPAGASMRKMGCSAGLGMLVSHPDLLVDRREEQRTTRMSHCLCVNMSSVSLCEPRLDWE